MNALVGCGTSAALSMPVGVKIFQCRTHFTGERRRDSALRVTHGFQSHGRDGTRRTVVSVPHAGRAYPGWVSRALAVPLECALPLEDRFVDRLATDTIARGHRVLIAETPRLVIDLNRAETDFDPASVSGSWINARPSTKARGGLGLIPERLGGVGRLWHAPIDATELSHRIATCHRPYHDALATALNASVARFGTALLIDLHSMPPIGGYGAPQIVIGDRHGRTASPELIAAAQAVCAHHGLRTALNVPYAGGFIVERHARPATHVYALQIEIDRRLYLDAAMDALGNGAATMNRMIADLIDRLEAALTQTETAIAAE